jgi:hypothetical protein
MKDLTGISLNSLALDLEKVLTVSLCGLGSVKLSHRPEDSSIKISPNVTRVIPKTENPDKNPITRMTSPNSIPPFLGDFLSFPFVI